MPINVEIERNTNENNLGVLRRFRNRIRTSGVLKKSRSGRFHERSRSQFVQKKSKLKSLDKQKAYERLYKLGKISDER